MSQNHLTNPELVGHPLFKLTLIFNLFQTGFILIPFFTQSVNVASEYGLTAVELQWMVVAGTLCECACRPFIGSVSQKLGITRMATLWSVIWSIQNLVRITVRQGNMFYLIDYRFKQKIRGLPYKTLSIC